MRAVRPIAHPSVSSAVRPQGPAATSRAFRSLGATAVMVALLGVLPSVGAGQGVQGPSVAGAWHGAIETPGSPLEIAITLTEEGGLLAGTIDIPAQGAAGMPLGDLQRSGDSIRFAIANVPGAPTFNGTVGDDGITGTFTQGAGAFPFHLERGELAPPARPQEPTPPFPYRTEDVSYQNGDVTLAGTLTTPGGDGPFPAAVLITGSGAQDRDEALAGHRPFLVLADHLTRAGVAVLRVDDRGVGGSTGSTMQSTTEDFAEDALAGVAFLVARDEIANDRIGLIGHSEGGLVAPLAAGRSEDVAFVVLLAGPSVSIAEVLPAQNEALVRGAGGSAVGATMMANLITEMIEIRRTTPDSAGLAVALRDPVGRQLQLSGIAPSEAELDAATAQAIAQFGSAWFGWILDYDPVPALEALRVPVLALNGELDLQVLPEQNIGPLEAALEAAPTTDVTVTVLPGLNHLFQTAATGSPTEYATIEETMSPEVLAIVAEWVTGRFGGEAKIP